MKTETANRVRDHIAELAKLFPGIALDNPLNLARKLRRLEADVTRWTTALCNGESDPTEDEIAAAGAEFRARLLACLREPTDSTNPAAKALHINTDPRGYALKIGCVWMAEWHKENPDCRLHTDWGGYGIIAPDLH